MKTLKILGATVTIIAVVTIGLYVTGYLQTLIFQSYMYFNQPDHDFDPAKQSPAPDYNDPSNWAARPETNDPADLVPEGIDTAVEQGRAPVDVFFIHPTGYFGNESWTSPMEPDSATEENTKWMMANQASAFNGCCNIYAPRYREATLFAYVNRSRDEILAFAYQDVLRAFEHFLSNDNDGRPFILASHSQGTHHARRLLEERIDTGELHERLVAAYIIGSVNVPISRDWFARMQHISPCRSAGDTGCVIHWDTVAEGGAALQREADSLCTNPLTWSIDEARAGAGLHDGAVPITGTFNASLGGNAPTGHRFDHLDAPIARHTPAQCRNGTLFVAEQTDPRFATAIAGDSYHGLDYPLFHMDIRNNARRRVTSFLEAGGE